MSDYAYDDRDYDFVGSGMPDIYSADGLKMLYFHNKGCGVWQAHLRGVKYAPCAKGLQPSSEQEVWLCRVNDTESEPGLTRVTLLKVLFTGETALHFVLDSRRQVRGKAPWNARLPLMGHQTIICSPDVGGQQPSEEDPFWICKFQKLIYTGQRGDFFIVVVKLVRIDHEAKAKAEAERLEEIELQKLLAKEQAEYLAQSQADDEARAERWKRRHEDDERLYKARKMPGRGCVTRLY